MSKIYLFLSLFLLTNLSFSCDCNHDDEITCFEFDQRQCGGDDWAELVPINDNEADREAKMKTYLESKDIDIESVNLVLNYHGGVCYACYVCPEADRFFVEIDKDDQSKLEALDLLNFGSVDCE